MEAASTGTHQARPVPQRAPDLAALEAATAAVSPTLADMIVEAEKTVRERVRSWPERIAKGRLTLPKAASKLAAMRRIAGTLQWLAANEAWIKAEAARRAREAKQRNEAVALVTEHFPGATVIEDGTEDQQETEQDT